MTTIHTKVRNGLVTTALAGCVALFATPAHAAVAPEPDKPAVVSGGLSKAAIEHYEADTTGSTGTSGTSSTSSQLSKAAIEHNEAVDSGAGSNVPGVLASQTKAQVEAVERAAAQQAAASSSRSTTGTPSDDGSGSALLTVLALLRGGLITGAASSYTLARMRNTGPAPRTA